MDGFRAFRAHKENGKVSGRVEELSLTDLAAGEVVLKVAYSSVNYKDALAATGTGKILTRFPIIPGIDVAGYVEESSDSRFQPGAAVLATGYDLGVGHDGGFSEFVRLPAAWLIPLPTGLTLFEAMALGTAGFTVALCIKRLQDNGQTPAQGPLLVTGATGGVGSIAVDVLSRLGYQVVALTGKHEAEGFLRQLGAQQVIFRDEVKFGERPLERAQWGGGIDNVGGATLTWFTRTTMPWGNICSVGLAGGSQFNATVMPFLLRGVCVLGVTSAGCPPDWRAYLWLKLATEWRPRNLDRIVTQVVPLDGLPGVFQTMLKGALIGRTVVQIGNE